MENAIEYIDRLMQEHGHVAHIYEIRDGITTAECQKCRGRMSVVTDETGTLSAALVMAICRPYAQAREMAISA